MFLLPFQLLKLGELGLGGMCAAGSTVLIQTLLALFVRSHVVHHEEEDVACLTALHHVFLERASLKLYKVVTIESLVYMPAPHAVLLVCEHSDVTATTTELQSVEELLSHDDPHFRTELFHLGARKFQFLCQKSPSFP